ncbi:uncharacterized protein [Littorina saxatilis]|uniref:uncharacterized protein isoform X2 n=1 Tax=Littorina saxatilis TaxID=31220 RepID=UPI0038B53365
MKSFGLLLLGVLLLAVIKVRAGQVKTVCILIPAYNLEDFLEGENEEDEIKGWGPGPGVPTGYRPTLVTDTKGGARGGGGAASPTGSSGAGSYGSGAGSYGSGAGSYGSGAGSYGRRPPMKAGPMGPMTDPSKPPGPNPMGGYWEWDSEDGMWELEDDRRKRRQAPGSILAGRLQCGPGTTIHVDKVTLGFSIDNRCRPVRPLCHTTSTLGRQVSHCEGQAGVCKVTVAQQFLHRCGRRTNYARIQYECIAESEKHNICEAKSFTSTGSLLISSPSFTRNDSAAHAEYLSCECAVSRGSSASLSIPWLRTQLDTGDQGVCGEEMVLLDTWDESANRFTLQEELCGLRSVRYKTFNTPVVKLTFIPSFNHVATNGFLFKIQGKPDPKAKLQVTCSVVSSGSPVAGPPRPPPPSPAQSSSSPVAGPPPPLSPPQSSSSSSVPAAAAQPGRPQLPPTFDLSKYPGLLNKTLSAWRNRMNQEGSVAGQTGQQAQPAQPGSAGAVVHQGSEPDSLLNKTLSAWRNRMNQEGSVAGQTGQQAQPAQPGSAGAVVHQGSEPDSDQFNVSGTSGTLSAVVASLGSVIIIIGSLVAFFAYKKYQKKKKQGAVHYNNRSTVRSDAGLYSEATYQDPTGPGSSIPTALTIPAPVNSTTTMAESQKTSDPLPNPGRRASSDGHAPSLPKRPPRAKKEKCRRLADEEEVAYDNAASVEGNDVMLLKDADYASLEDISKALGCQDNAGDVEVDLTEEVEVKTESCIC